VTIASDIAATNPNLWWKLDEGSGTVAHNSGSLANNGTISGSVDWTVPGPEIGTTAIRLVAGAGITSLAMDLGTNLGVSLGVWCALPANGPVPNSHSIVRLGDVGNLFNRGLLLWEGHNVIGAPTAYARINTSLQNQFVLPDPKNGWHFLVLTNIAGSSNFKFFVDGIERVNQAGANATPPLITDPVFVSSDEPIVVAHVLFWNRAVTATELGTIGANVASAVYAIPVNYTPDGGGGGGGLTPDQAAQLTDIQTKVADIPGLVSAVNFISATVNTINGNVNSIGAVVNTILSDVQSIGAQLGQVADSVGTGLHDLVDNVWNGVRRVFQTAGGIGISTPLGALISHPDPNLLSYSSDAFLLSGRGELTPPTGPFLTRPYGIAWDATTIPPGAGFREGAEIEFIGRLVQFCPLYPEVGSGILYIPEVADFSFKTFYWLWERYTPQVVQYDVTVGFELTCRWIVLL